MPLPGIPFDAMRGRDPQRVPAASSIPATGAPVEGEYVVGWIKRGPQGIIGTNKPDSQETVDMLLEDLAAGNLHKLEVPSRAVLERLLGERRRDFVSYEDWQLIDLLEQERGKAAAPRGSSSAGSRRCSTRSRSASWPPPRRARTTAED